MSKESTIYKFAEEQISDVEKQVHGKENRIISCLKMQFVVICLFLLVITAAIELSVAVLESESVLVKIVRKFVFKNGKQDIMNATLSFLNSVTNNTETPITERLYPNEVYEEGMEEYFNGNAV